MDGVLSRDLVCNELTRKGVDFGDQLEQKDPTLT